MANYSFTDPGDAIEDGATISSGNFSQLYPDTPIMVGKPLTITGGNWVNVRQDPVWTITGGNWTQVSRCANKHPDWVSKGLDACIENCDHVIDVEVIEINGVEVLRIYKYEDTVL